VAKKSKSYTLSFAQKPGYVHAVAIGRNSVENMHAYLEEVVRECAAQRGRRVLIEEKLDGPRLGMVDVFDLASAVSERARGSFDAIAYVDVNAENDLNVKFGENVAVNRGLRVRVFRTVEDAAEWLKG
jgi:hypothetical protein